MPLADEQLPLEAVSSAAGAESATAAGSAGSSAPAPHAVDITSIEPVVERRLTDFGSEPQLWKPFWHTTYLIATDLLRANRIEYPLLSRGEDPVFLARVLLTSRPVSLMSDIVYLYRRYRKTSGSKSRDARALEDALLFLRAAVGGIAAGRCTFQRFLGLLTFAAEPGA